MGTFTRQAGGCRNIRNGILSQRGKLPNEPNSPKYRVYYFVESWWWRPATGSEYEWGWGAGAAVTFLSSYQYVHFLHILLLCPDYTYHSE